MVRHWVRRGLQFVIFAVVFLAVFSLIVMKLWNWLVPAVFGWHLITFWQAVGLLVLSKILFGGFRGLVRTSLPILHKRAGIPVGRKTGPGHWSGPACSRYNLCRFLKF